MWPHHVLLQMQMQCSASAVDKMKIEPAMISFMKNTTSSKMGDQNDDFTAKESCKSLSFCFLKVSNGQNAGNT